MAYGPLRWQGSAQLRVVEGHLSAAGPAPGTLGPNHRVLPSEDWRCWRGMILLADFQSLELQDGALVLLDERQPGSVGTAALGMIRATLCS